jgi:hypothetical protein
MKKNRKKLLKVFVEYGIHLWVILITVNLAVLYAVHFFIMGATCMTAQQVSSDSRCLYIWGQQIYQIGSRPSGHHGHPCGTDVTTVMPSSHTSNQASYLLPNYVANVCTAVAPTPTATPKPASPTAKPTNTPIPNKAPTATPKQQPTSTPKPTPTSPPNATQLGFTLLIHGIGNGGDGANPKGIGNMTPLHPQKTITIEVFNSNNLNVATVQGLVTYDKATGYYKGNISLGNGISTGYYSVRIKVTGYLRKIIPGIQNIQAGKINTVTPVPLVTGDIDNDNILSVLDYNLLMNCYSDLLPPTACADDNAKQAADLNDDGNVNQFDYNLFFRELAFRTGD